MHNQGVGCNGSACAGSNVGPTAGQKLGYGHLKATPPFTEGSQSLLIWDCQPDLKLLQYIKT